ncbi:MAG: hypothetical protein JWQ90_720 [Hydrocarboniphaga sp.]|uniref:oxidoreductase-like domain-containing protein n=1 Tax=Hydrocarboniphaga sp. TaxID=2033016 RepID=UPI002617F456|nr:oxidoreductase-like domain-containing protein [Hydrocarboniphaga sp.]MDB5968270.1 hypothetical protein [Hydrocarboniphaga sp.]
MNPPQDAREDSLPPEPERPDCCNGGCAVCVLDGFEDEVQAWRRQCEAILAQRSALKAGAQPPPS